MASKIIVSKKEFLSNVNEWCWAGNGRCDLATDTAFLPEVVCATYTKWLEEWVVRFNTVNDGFKVKLIIETGEYLKGYTIARVEPDRISFPEWDDVEHEEYALTEEEVKDAGEITHESNTVEDE
tara:strand:- start:891 stop:1262 length:372 start_codon:yes stop_codon:yes gene_type:complete